MSGMAETMPAVPGALESLDREIAELGEIAKQLEMTLAPILELSEPTSDKVLGTVKRTALEEKVGSLTDVRITLSDLLRRIQL